MTPTPHPVTSAFLRVGAALYGGGVRLRNRHYDRPGASWKGPLPVISVGNLTVGGTGKTPLVAWLARTILSMGLRPAIVSRGYGGTAGKGPLLVSEGRGPLCPARVSGDEPNLLARYLDGVTIVVGSDRCAGTRAAARAGSDAVILDDGFQHRRLARDLDIVLLDASSPFGNHRLLPAGLLREPVSGLGRADVVVVTRSRPDEDLTGVESVVRGHNPTAPVLRAGHKRIGFFDARGASVPAPVRGVVFCGIGNPAIFRSDLESCGIEVVEFMARRDHHPHTTDEIENLHALAVKHGASLITTEKDMVRLPGDATSFVDPAPVALRIETEIYDPDPLLAAVKRVLDVSGER